MFAITIDGRQPEPCRQCGNPLTLTEYHRALEDYDHINSLRCECVHCLVDVFRAANLWHGNLDSQRPGYVLQLLPLGRNLRIIHVAEEAHLAGTGKDFEG